MKMRKTAPLLFRTPTDAYATVSSGPPRRLEPESGTVHERIILTLP
jgi:hypothetical protein